MPISNPRSSSTSGSLNLLRAAITYATTDPVAPSVGTEYIFNWQADRLWRGDGNGGWTEQSIDVFMAA